MAKRKGSTSGTLESIFLRLEELVLANSGEDEFEEIFKLLIAKIWDERKRTGLFRAGGSDQEVAARISTLLKQVDIEWPGIVPAAAPRLTPEHLHVCVAALESHAVGNDTLEALDGFFEFLVARAAKGAKGQFFTPRHVIELCIRMIEPQPHETVLDPACGSGGFLIHALHFVGRSLASPASLTDYARGCLWGFDVDARAVRIAKTMLMMAAGVDANIFRSNSLVRPTMVSGIDDEVAITIEDVCRTRRRRHRGFDVIVTNPPFAGEVCEPNILQAYALSHGKKRIERDVLFIERCLELLRPGGRLGIVLPHNIMGSDSLRFVREWIVKKGRVLGAVGLGRNTFLPHTHQKASLLFVQREDARVTDYNIFFAVSERDGKNSKGQIKRKVAAAGGDVYWNGVDHDFLDILDAFQAFCRKEGVQTAGAA